MNSRKTWIWTLIVCASTLWLIHLGAAKVIAKGGEQITGFANWVDNSWQSLVSKIPNSNKIEMSASIVD